MKNTVRKCITQVKKIKGFNSDLICFEPDGDYNLNICFLINGSIIRLNFFCYDGAIDLIKKQVEEFFKTGQMDFKSYWILTDAASIDPQDIGKVFGFDLKRKGNTYYFGESECFPFLDKYRQKFPNCGMEHVSK